jgi:hypothetical protein
MEIGFVPGDAQKNNGMALEVMRKVGRLSVSPRLVFSSFGVSKRDRDWYFLYSLQGRLEQPPFHSIVLDVPVSLTLP